MELNLTNEEKIVNILASSYSLEIVDLNEKKIDQKIKQILDLRFIEENFIVPFEISGQTLKIAIPDASKLSLMKNLKTMTQMEPELYAASISNIKKFVDRLKDLETKKKNPSNVKIEKIKKKDEDELVEVTPENLRLRKMELDQNKRASQKKKEKYANQ